MGLCKLLFFLYLIGCIHHSFMGVYSTFCLDFTNITNPRLLDLKEHNFRYLTTWNFLSQCIYLDLALIVEILSLFKSMSRIIPSLKVVKGTLFSSIIFPAGIFVSSMFWVLYAIQRDYVLPDGFETVLPIWLNHGIHTFILYLVIIEVALGELYIPKPLPILVFAALFTIIYTIQYFILRYQTGRWLYGVMYYLDQTGIILFTMFINIYFLVLTFIGLLIVRRKSNRFVLTEQDKKKLPLVSRCYK